MTDSVGRDSAPAPAAPSPPEAPSVPVWAQATLADPTDFAFEAPIAGSKSASGRDLSDAFQKAMEAEKGSASPDEKAARVFAMLAGVTSMYHRPEDRNAPYGPLMQMEDGRTAIPEDFRGDPVAALAYMAERAADPTLRARLSIV